MKKLILKNVSRYVLDRIPELGSYHNYLSLDSDEKFDLPYVLFGVLYKFYVDNFSNHEIRKKVDQLIENISSSSGKELEELICFGFLENINMRSNIFDDMINGFGKNTRRLLKETIEHNEKLGKLQKGVYKRFGVSG